VTRFWLSWEEPSKDYRPLNFPPNAAVLGWWCSGCTAEEAATLCALVEADNESAAKAAIDADWPAKERVWRFIDAVAIDYLPSDRFPPSDWMKVRMAPKGVK